MKHIFSIILLVIFYASIATIAFSTIGSIGYGLYLWGSVGLAFSASCWTAFVLWLKMFFGGLATMFIALAGLHLLG